MTINKLRVLAGAGLATMTLSSAAAQNLGELRVVFAKEGRTEVITPDKLFGGDIKTPKKGAPYLYVAWRIDEGAQSDANFKSNMIVFNAKQDDATGLGVGVLFERNKKSTHYASRCSWRTMPKCDPTLIGLTHDPKAKKVYLKNVVFERVSLEKIDPADLLTVSGELSYMK